MQSALDRALTTLCDSDVEVLINLCSSVMDPKGKVTVEYKDWNAQFLHVCLELCKYLTNDEVLRYVIGLCEVNHVLSGQRDTITVVLVLGNGKLVWIENVLMQSAEILEDKGALLRNFVPDSDRDSRLPVVQVLVLTELHLLC